MSKLCVKFQKEPPFRMITEVQSNKYVACKQQKYKPHIPPLYPKGLLCKTQVQKKHHHLPNHRTNYFYQILKIKINRALNKAFNIRNTDWVPSRIFFPSRVPDLKQKYRTLRYKYRTLRHKYRTFHFSPPFAFG